MIRTGVATLALLVPLALALLAVPAASQDVVDLTDEEFEEARRHCTEVSGVGR